MPAPHAEILADRRDAGRRLGERLARESLEDPVVLGIPRGGVPVAYEVAKRLGAPLDVLIVRKVGAPRQPEYGLGAVSEGGFRLIDLPRVRDAGYTVEELEPYIRRQVEEVERRLTMYRGGTERLRLTGRTVLVVDDGVATGGTIRAALRCVRAANPHRVVLAVGVCPRSTFRALRPEADELVALLTPEDFFAVGEWYRDFPPVPDGEVIGLLSASRGGERLLHA